MCDQDNRSYIAELCREMLRMAQKTRRPLLTYLLRLVIAEAERP